jgi:amino acid transporter
MFVIGLWIYARATPARNRRGRWGLAGLAAFLVVVYVGNIVGPPPPTVQTVAVGALVGFVVLILWSWWVDRHREAILRAP